MGTHWYIEPNDRVKLGSLIIDVGLSSACCPYMLLYVEENEGMFIFTFRGRSVGETIVCCTKSLKERPKCFINGEKKRAPKILIPFCRSDTKVREVYK